MIPLSSRWSVVEEIAKVALAFGSSHALFWYAVWALGLSLAGCGGTGSMPLSTPYLDEIAAERARNVCMYAGVAVQDMPACIERGVNSRQSTQWFGGWSPI